MNVTKFILSTTVTTFLLVGLAFPLQAQQQIVPDAIVGLDQISLAVNDLETATATYRALGFAIEPGAPLANGIRTNSIKFPDGSGIELITAPDALDELTETYRKLLEVAEGPAFFSFHARDRGKLSAALKSARLQFDASSGRVEPDSNVFSYLVFGLDNRSPTDRRAHFAHANGASALGRVWIATDNSRDLQQLLVTLGGEATDRTVFAPNKAEAKVVALTNGELVILPKARQITKNRPVIGATFNVGAIAVLERRLTNATIAFTKGGSGGQSIIVAPAETHGIWLEFRE